jgi:putative transposase
LLKIARSSFYYKPQSPSDEELTLLRLLDQQYLETPFYGGAKVAFAHPLKAWAKVRKSIRTMTRRSVEYDGNRRCRRPINSSNTA